MPRKNRGMPTAQTNDIKPYAPPFPCGFFRKFVSYGRALTYGKIITTVLAKCQGFFRILFCKFLTTTTYCGMAAARHNGGFVPESGQRRPYMLKNGQIRRP